MKIHGNAPSPHHPEVTKQQGRGASPLLHTETKPSAEAKLPAPAKLSAETNLLSALKLPQDNVSRAIIGFARFFSLPLTPKMLTMLRQNALNPGTAAREAAVLGAAAAMDKGLKMGDKALGEYAAAIEGSLKSFIREQSAQIPVYQQKDDPAEQNSDQEGYNQEENNGPEDQNNNSQNNSQNDGTGGNFRGSRQEKQPVKPPELQRITESLNERPLLDLINRIPGKNGQWVVVPFSFSREGLEFAVSLRIFLNKSPLPAEVPVLERLCADIKVTRPDKAEFSENTRKLERHWVITLEKPPAAGASRNSEILSSESRITVFVEPKIDSSVKKWKIRRELAKVTGLPPERVVIMDKQPLFADSRESTLRSVDEKV